LSRADVAAAVAKPHNFCPSRYASIRTLRELTLFGGSVHRMRSVFIRTNRVLQSSERSLLIKGDQVHIAQSP
jgi:hypothetical protein